MKKQSSISGLNTIGFTLKGVAPLIMHNGQTADPLNKYSKMLKAVTSKKSKTDADYLEIARIEFYAGIYVNDKGQVIMPARNLSACLTNGAKKSKLGNQFKSGVFVFDDSLLVFPDADKTVKELWDSEKYTSRVGVSVGQATCIRTRPIFSEWECQVEIAYNPELVNEQSVTKAFQDAGIQCGLGDWTPQHGRFRVEKV